MDDYSIIDVIRSRYSCRSFQNKPISDQLKSELLKYAEENNAGPFGTHSRFHLGQVTSGLAILRRLNTYGFINGTDEFLVGVTTKCTDQLELEEFGYVLEKIILKATALGLGTCWMGGTFRKSVFSNLIGLKENESLPAVIAIGYPAAKKRRTDRMIRKFAKSDHRRAWERLFFYENFDTPLKKGETGKFTTALEMLRLAPSASNKQPWNIVKSDNSWHFYLRRTHGYQDQPILAKTGKADLQRIDIGIAMSHFDMTLLESKIIGKWVIDNPKITLPDDLTEYKISWVPKNSLSNPNK